IRGLEPSLTQRRLKWLRGDNCDAPRPQSSRVQGSEDRPHPLLPISRSLISSYTLGRTSDCRTIFEKKRIPVNSTRGNVPDFSHGCVISDQCKLANYRQRTDVTPADENTIIIVLTQHGMLGKNRFESPVVDVQRRFPYATQRAYRDCVPWEYR
ncbi:hypothetical protein K0M31_010834, partial [Melipona bicolor]